jgi:hypothetical protein
LIYIDVTEVTFREHLALGLLILRAGRFSFMPFAQNSRRELRCIYKYEHGESCFRRRPKITIEKKQVADTSANP